MGHPKWTSSAPLPSQFVGKFDDYKHEKIEALEKLLTGKRVAVVGPSPHILGLKQGEKIDNYDVVVRIGQIFPIPKEVKEDVGTKFNIVAHSFNQFQIPVCDKEFLNSLDFVLCSMASLDFKPEHDAFINSLSTNALNLDDLFFYKMCRDTGTIINSGFAAMLLLLEYDIAELFVTGYSFYNMGKYGDVYYDKYEHVAKSTAMRAKGEFKNITPKQARNDLHNQDRQIERFAELIKEHPVITLDDYLTENFLNSGTD